MSLVSAAYKSKTFKCSLTEVAERLLHFADIDVCLHLNEVLHKGIAEGILTGGEGEWKRQCTTSRFSCWNSLKTTAKFISKLSDDSEPARIIRYTEDSSGFSYLQHWQSLAEYLGRVKDVVGGLNPVLRVLPQICKLLQGCIGLHKDRTRVRACAMTGYQQDFITCLVCVCVAV